MNLELSRQIFGKYSNVIFHENSFGGKGVVPCRRRDVRTNIKKLIIIFRDFAKLPKNTALLMMTPTLECR